MNQIESKIKTIIAQLYQGKLEFNQSIIIQIRLGRVIIKARENPGKTRIKQCKTRKQDVYKIEIKIESKQN